jgi:hypothetical protein
MDIQALQAFFNEWLGKPVEVEDSTALDQCMDWAFKYCDDFLHIDHSIIRHQFAYQVYTEASSNTLQYFTLVANTPTGIPPAGALVVFDQSVGPAGHICVANGIGDTNTFTSTDQNWNGHAYVETVTHSYTGVLGWLVPPLRPTTPTTPTPIDETTLQTNLDACLAQHTELVTQLDQANTTITNLNTASSSKDTQIAKLDAEVSSLKSQVDSANQALDAKTKLADTLPSLQAQLQQAENDRTLALNASETQNRSIAQLKSQLASQRPVGLLNKILFILGK